MPRTVSRTTRWDVDVGLGADLTRRPRRGRWWHSVSHATRLFGSSSRMASSTASEIWSHILSGWPSVTDSDVKVKLLNAVSWLCAIAASRPAGAATSIEDQIGQRELGFCEQRERARSRRRRQAGSPPGWCRPRSRRRAARRRWPTMQVDAACARSLSAACSATSRRSRPRSRRAPGPAAWPRRARRGCRASARARSRASPSAFFSLRSGGRLGPEVGDRGRHDDDVGGVAARPSTASCISWPRSCTRTTSTPGGHRGRPMVVTSVTGRAAGRRPAATA